MKKFLCIVLTIVLIMSSFGTTVLANDDIISSKVDNDNKHISEEK